MNPKDPWVKSLVSSLGPYGHIVAPLRGRAASREVFKLLEVWPWNLGPFFSLFTSDTLNDQCNDDLPQHRLQINETTTLTVELEEDFPLLKFFCLRKLTNTEVGCKTKHFPWETQDVGLLTPDRDTTVIQSTDTIKVQLGEFHKSAVSWLTGCRTQHQN